MVFILIFLWHLNLFSVHLFNVLKLCTYYAPHTFLTIPDLSNLSLLSFSSDHSSKRLVSFIDLFKATTFYFNDFFSIIFLFFILLIFTLIFIISFFLLALGLVDSFFLYGFELLSEFTCCHPEELPFNISCMMGLLAMNSLSFCFSLKVFILPSFLKYIFARYKIFGWHIFLSVL